MTLKFFLAGSALLALTACGGGGGTLGGGVAHPISFASLDGEFDTLKAFDDANGPSASLPGVDGVGYSGIVLMAESLSTSTQGYLGDAEFTVNFSSETMSGSADNFYLARISSAGGSVSTPAIGIAGSLTFSNGDISSLPGAMDVTGTLDLDANGSLETTINGPGQIGPIFEGANGALLKAVDLNVSTSGAPFAAQEIDILIRASQDP